MLSYVVAVAGMASSILYAVAERYGIPTAAASASMVGVSYGWMEVRLLTIAAQDSMMPLRHTLSCLAVSLVAKTVISSAVGMASQSMQVLVLIACPTLVVIVIRLLARSPTLVMGGERGAAREGLVLRIPGKDKVTLIAFLIMAAVLSAVARALSNLGYWGGSNLVAGDTLAAMPLTAVLFLALSWVTLLRPTGQLLTNMIPCFLVLLGGFVALDMPQLVQGMYVPAPMMSSLTLLVEMYSHMLFWSSIAVGIVALEVHPYRVVGVAESSMSATAVILALALHAIDGASKVIVVVSIYASAIVVFCLLRKLRQLNSVTNKFAVQGERQLRAFASANALTARETDVFVLLAQGRDRSYIEHALGVSSGTVKTHIGHVYQKLGVHSKQELITLVQHMWEV